MEESPKFEEYSYESLLDVYGRIDEYKYPDRKARVAELLEERKDSEEAKALIERERYLSKYSTFVPRFCAAFLDGIFLTVIAFAIGLALGFFPSWLVIVTEYVTAFDLYIYSVLLHGLYGQTLGKGLMSVKVVNHSDEGDISFKQAFLRDSVPIAVIAITLITAICSPVTSTGEYPYFVQLMLMVVGVFHFIWFLIEIITMLSNEKRRALHDYIADTVVINV